MIDEEAIKRRFTESIDEVDARGRTFTVHRLRLSQQCAINEFTENPINRQMYLMTASVFKKDGMLIAPPKSLADITSVLDMLDEEGFEAVSWAWRQLNDPELDRAKLIAWRRSIGRATKEDLESVDDSVAG